MKTRHEFREMRAVWAKEKELREGGERSAEQQES
jgi:hypothetical protein